MNEKTKELRERLMSFSLRCLRLFRALPRSEESRVYGRQMLRSSSSVGNHREACRSRSKAEFEAKIGDSLKELDETAYWLELIRNVELLSPDKLEDLENETDQLIGIFVAILKSSKRSSSAMTG